MEMYDVTGVNVFPRKLMKFPPQKTGVTGALSTTELINKNHFSLFVFHHFIILVVIKFYLTFFLYRKSNSKSF